MRATARIDRTPPSAVAVRGEQSAAGRSATASVLTLRGEPAPLFGPAGRDRLAGPRDAASRARMLLGSVGPMARVEVAAALELVPEAEAGATLASVAATR